MKLTSSFRVADVPTAQNTLLAFPNPLVKNILVPLATFNEDPIWNIQTASTSPWASKNNWPAESAAKSSNLYTPGKRVRPPRSVLLKMWFDAWPVALL
jgi:hypothetical protein